LVVVFGSLGQGARTGGRGTIPGTMGQARVAAGAVLLLHVLVRLGDLVRRFSSLACEWRRSRWQGRFFIADSQASDRFENQTPNHRETPRSASRI